MNETNLDPVRLRVPPMFAAREKRMGIDETISELIDNARRSGAKRIDVRISQRADRCSVTDNGCGVSHPMVLLRPGTNGWSPRRMTGAGHEWALDSESPSGCGMFLLAQRGIDIETRTDGCSGWRVRVDLNALGAQRLAARTVEREKVGTQVTFDLERCESINVRAAVRSAAHYLSAAVFINGLEVEKTIDKDIEIVGRTDFKGGEIEVVRDFNLGRQARSSRTARESWRTKGAGHERAPNCSFFGRAARLPGLPAIPDGNAVWTVNLNVHKPTPLALTWPARNELAPGAARDELMNECLTAVYGMAATAQNTGTFPQAAIEEANRLGVKLEGTRAAQLQLREWTPSLPGCDTQPSELVDADRDAILISEDTLNYAEQQTLDAARKHGDGALKERATGTGRRLLAADAAMDGHPEYERLDRLATMSAYAIDDGERMPMAGDNATTGEVDLIEIELNLSRANGREASTIVAGDIALCWPARRNGWNESIAISRNSKAGVRQLAQRVVDAYLSEDEEDQSPGEASDALFEEAVRDIAKMRGDELTAAREVIELFADRMGYLIPEGHTIVIRKASGERATATIEPSEQRGGEATADQAHADA